MSVGINGGMTDMNEPGTYEVAVNSEKHTVDVDSFRYGNNDQLEAVKGGNVVAVFRWWDSIVKKPSE